MIDLGTCGGPELKTQLLSVSKHQSGSRARPLKTTKHVRAMRSLSVAAVADDNKQGIAQNHFAAAAARGASPTASQWTKSSTR